MTSTLTTPATVSALLCALLVNASAQFESPFEAIRALEQKWRGEVEDMEYEPIVFAPNGHIIVASPTKGAKLLGEKGAGGVNVRLKLTNTAGTFYMSDWSWNRFLLEGASPNWVVIPGAGRVGDRNATRFWNETYAHLRDDESSRNCRSAYAYFQQNRNDPVVVGVLAERLQNETDLQARAHAMAVLCESNVFPHDTKFCKEILDLLSRYLTEDWPGERKLQVYQGGCARSMIHFIVRNAVKYQKQIAPYLSSEDMMLKWLATHSLVRHNLHGNYRNHFDEKFFSIVFYNLRDDASNFNAQQAARTLVMLRPISNSFVGDRLRRTRLDSQEEWVLDLFEDDLLNQANRLAFNEEMGGLCSELFYVGEVSGMFNPELPMFLVNGESID